MKPEYVVEVHSYIPHDEIVRFPFSSPEEALSKLEQLNNEVDKFTNARVLRDDEETSEDDLREDMNEYGRMDFLLSSDVEGVRETQTKLPLTYRPSRGGDADVGLGTDWKLHGVWKPPNPEDDYRD